MFHENINESFWELKDDSDFHNVTLAFDDEKQIDVNRMVLSACSPVLKSIIKKSKQPHTFIYLSGLNSSTISSLIDFMYNGEVSVVQEDLDGFLSAANRLKIKGLSQALETSENLKESFNQEHKGKNAQVETIVDDLFVTENCEDQTIEENFDTTATVLKEELLPLSESRGYFVDEEGSGFRFENNLG